jgi:hypothetical protein
VQLQINAVLQAQDLEFVFREFAGEATLHLIAEFFNALVDERAVEFVICVHDGKPYAGTGRSIVRPCDRICSRRLPGRISPSLTSTGAI